MPPDTGVLRTSGGPSTPGSLPAIDRQAIVDTYRSLRARSRLIFDLLDPELYYERPIALRNPVVFYEGHIPGFTVNTLIKKGLGWDGVDQRLERIFARGIDPESVGMAQPRHGEGWPTREEVSRFVRAADELVEEALQTAPIDQVGVPVLHRAEGVYAVLEHEAMHQETLLYMWHRFPLDRKHRPSGYRPVVEGVISRAERCRVPGGLVTVGADREHTVFGWDNEFPAHRVEVGAFAVDRFNVTNAAFSEFVEIGGYGDARWWTPRDWSWVQTEQVAHPLFWERHDGHWCWRGQFDLLPLPRAWPVYVTHAEAAAYARWRGGRLMTEPEFHRAAFGTPDGGERPWPWGGASPELQHGTFNFKSWDPVPVGSSPEGASAWGLEDLMGNGWEWTATPFQPFEGFAPMAAYPEYSAEFFDGEHFVLKGASPVTPRELLRGSLRNWFRPRYPYVYATFRCAYDV